MLIKNRWCVEGTQVTLCHLLTSLCLDFFHRKMDTITYFIGLLWGLIELLIIQLEQYCTWYKFIVSWCKEAVLFLHLRINGGLPLWPRAPWLRLQSSNAGDIDLNTGWGTKVPQASRSKKSVVPGLCQSWISDCHANSFCCFVCWWHYDTRHWDYLISLANANTYRNKPVAQMKEAGSNGNCGKMESIHFV